MTEPSASAKPFSVKSPSQAAITDRLVRRDKRARAAAMALTGLLGIAWAAVIVGRYPEILPT
jgi:hypothetical protein